MWIRRDGPIVRVASPAKLNLFLEIFAKRTDGFHEIETLIIAVNLFDWLTFTATSDASIQLRCQPAAAFGLPTKLNHSVRGGVGGFGELPSQQNNLALKALQLLQARSGCQQGGRATLIKRIPPASGLGGGSGNAAAALLAANGAWRLNWPRERLAELAMELGSDVPFFLTPSSGHGATMAICRGRGEKVAAATAPAGLSFVVVRPAEGLSTADVYRRCQPAAAPRRVDDLHRALVDGNYPAAAIEMKNQLQAAAAQVSPTVERLAEQFGKLRPIAHQLSGSGSAYFGWFHSTKSAAQAAGRMRSWGHPFVWQVRSI